MRSSVADCARADLRRVSDWPHRGRLAVEAPPQPPRSPRAAAPVDFTGYWVSVVTEDWRWRMVTPAQGDFAGVPLNAAARKIGQAWDPAKDEAEGNQCKAYGAAGIMRMPGRLHITWQDDTTLKIETDQGTQTRLLHFGGKPAPGLKPSWQGYSSRELGRPAARIGSARLSADRTQPARRHARSIARSGHDESSRRVPAEERRALQREHDAARVLRSVHRAQRRHLVRRHDDRRGPADSDARRS